MPTHAFDAKSRFAKSLGMTHPVQIGLKIYLSFLIDRQIIIHQHSDLFNISASTHQVDGDQHLPLAITEPAQ